jgi:hypothetical protein
VQLSHTAKLISRKQQADEDSSDEEDKEQQQQQQQGPQAVNEASGPSAPAGTDQDSLQDTAEAGADNVSNAAADTAAANGTSNSSSGSSWSFTFSISSLHGLSCPLPMVASASVSCLGDAAAAGLKPRQLSGQLPWRLTRSCPAGLQQVQLQVQFALVDAADEGRRSATVSGEWLLDPFCAGLCEALTCLLFQRLLMRAGAAQRELKLRCDLCLVDAVCASLWSLCCTSGRC